MEFSVNPVKFPVKVVVKPPVICCKVAVKAVSFKINKRMLKISLDCQDLVKQHEFSKLLPDSSSCNTLIDYLEHKHNKKVES
jgi:hypothetical protein